MFVSYFCILMFLMNIFNKTNGNVYLTKMSNNEATLFDFTTKDDPSEWIEQSDPVREVGMSKAIFVKQKTQIFQRGIIFFLLNPQPNGAGFAGIRIIKTIDLNAFSNIIFKIRGQGENVNYKIVLRHKGKNDEPNPTYEQYFTAPFRKFDVISLPLNNFKAYYRGKPVPDAEPLDTSRITSIGIQIYGGVYSEQKQMGASTLEIDWIKATR